MFIYCMSDPLGIFRDSSSFNNKIAIVKGSFLAKVVVSSFYQLTLRGIPGIIAFRTVWSKAASKIKEFYFPQVVLTKIFFEIVRYFGNDILVRQGVLVPTHMRVDTLELYEGVVPRLLP